MIVRWSPEAADSLESISRYLRQVNPQSAQKIASTIFDSAESLATFPHRGRIGRVPGTRELVLSPLPYLIVYRVKDQALEILRILHGAQQWP
jgi:addiction module RelE/StbE family toxin